MMRSAVPTIVAAALLAALAAAASHGQTVPPPVQTPTPPAGPASAPKPQAAPPRAATPAPGPARATVVIMVTDQSGAGLPDVHVSAIGPVTREGLTGRDGTLRWQALRTGSYRLRFQAEEFVTLEREATVKAGAPTEIDVALNRDAAKPKPAEPEPVPAPAPPAGRGPAAPDPNASVEMLSLPDWIERNLIGRSDPIKETNVGKTTATTSTVLQVREPLKDRVRDDADEMLYVIAGQGVLRSKGRDHALDAGSFVVIPRGVGYSIERRGRNPLIALSIVGN